MAKFKTRKERLSYDQPKLGILGALPKIDGPLLGAGMGGGGKLSSKGFFESRKKGKTRKEVEQQGGPLNKKLDDFTVGEILEEHGVEWEYHKNGGITAKDISITGKNEGYPRKIIIENKYFKPNTSLGAIRNWLGY